MASSIYSVDSGSSRLVWRPHLPESIDGAPLITTISDLFFDFPYDRLPENKAVAFFMRPDAMLALVVLYLISKEPLKMLISRRYISPKGEGFQRFVALHNLSLAVFSAVTMWNSWNVVYAHLSQRGFFHTFCDVEGTLWQSGLGAWAFIFYVSKYYEFLDTAILVLKGKEASFLQVYHHTGIVLCMWGGVVCQSAWLLFVVCLNSMIHTLMYTYFLIKTLYPDIQIKQAKHLTMAQIGQLVFGITCSFAFQFLGDDCDNSASRFMLFCLFAYGASLVGLFRAFAKKKYNNNNSSNSSTPQQSKAKINQKDEKKSR